MDQVWGRVPIALVQDRNVRPTDLKVYVALSSFQGNNGSCHPSLEQIAERCNVRCRHVQEAIGRLEERWLDVARHHGRRNQYQVHDTPKVNTSSVVTSIGVTESGVNTSSVTPPTTDSVVPVNTDSVVLLKEQYKTIEKNNDGGTPEQAHSPPPPSESPKKRSQKPKPKPIRFDFGDKLWHGITPEQESIWERAFPAVHLETEYAKAAAWCLNNGARGRKQNWGRFLHNWLSRAQDAAGRPQWR